MLNNNSKLRNTGVTDLSSLSNVIPISTDDERFNAQAMAEYIDSRASDLEEIAACITEFIDKIEVNDDGSVDITAVTEESFFQALEKRGLAPDSVITLSDGSWTTPRMFAIQLAEGAEKLLNDSDDSVEDAVDIMLEVYNENNEIVRRDYDFVMSSIKESIASSRMYASALSASVLSNISDRLNYYKNRVTEVYDTSVEWIRNNYNYYSTLLREGASPYQLIRNFMSLVGAEQIAASEKPIETMLNQPVTEFTGSSPLSAFTVTDATDAFEATWKTVCKVGSAIGNAIISLGSSLFNTAATAIEETFIDPVSVGEIKDVKDASAIIDGFQYQYKGKVTLWNSDVDNYQHDHELLLAKVIPEYCNKFGFNTATELLGELFVNHFGAHKWVECATPGGILHFKIDNWGGAAAIEKGRLQIEATFKPYLSNPQSFPFITSDSAITDPQIFEDVASLMGQLTVPRYLSPTSSSENQIYRGILCSLYASQIDATNRTGSYIETFYNMFDDLRGQIVVDDRFANQYPDGKYRLQVKIPSPNKDILSNLDFVTVASGMNTSIDTGVTKYDTIPTNICGFPDVTSVNNKYVRWFPDVPTSPGLMLYMGETYAGGINLTSFIEIYIAEFLRSLLMSRMLRKISMIFDGIAFMPYKTNVSSLPLARYYIKTDDEESEVATRFVQAAIVVLGTVVVVKGVSGVFKKIFTKNSKQLKGASALAQKLAKSNNGSGQTIINNVTQKVRKKNSLLAPLVTGMVGYATNELDAQATPPTGDSALILPYIIGPTTNT